MIRKATNEIVHGRHPLALLFLLAAAVALVRCGNGSSTPSTPATPTRRSTPARARPDADSVDLQPDAAGDLRHPDPGPGQLGAPQAPRATPIVINEDEYCGKVGFDPNQLYCETRQADDPLKRPATPQPSAGPRTTAAAGRPVLEGQPCAPGSDPGVRIIRRTSSRLTLSARVCSRPAPP